MGKKPNVSEIWKDRGHSPDGTKIFEIFLCTRSNAPKKINSWAVAMCKLYLY